MVRTPEPQVHDVFLKRMFGDYMKMPPVESRKNHVPEVLEFGPFDGHEYRSENGIHSN